jgi:hypothetical protein
MVPWMVRQDLLVELEVNFGLAPLLCSLALETVSVRMTYCFSTTDGHDHFFFSSEKGKGGEK